jgi:hypothetical protein
MKAGKRMNCVLLGLAGYGRFTVLHIVVVALALTAFFMTWTSSALGVMAPLVIALSGYLVVALVLVELLLLLRAAVRYVARRSLSGIREGE